MPKLKNAVIVKDMYGDDCLFGEVYDDLRYTGEPNSEFENGHHILTSKISEVDGMRFITKTGTLYEVQNMMSKSEIIKYIQATYTDEVYKTYLLGFIR